MAGKAKETADETAARLEAEAKEAARQQAHDLVDEHHDRADALAAVPQKVIDGNETAALDTITGQKPERDMSDAPAANELGPHHAVEGEDAAASNDPKGDG